MNGRWLLVCILAAAGLQGCGSPPPMDNEYGGKTFYTDKVTRETFDPRTGDIMRPGKPW